MLLASLDMAIERLRYFGHVAGEGRQVRRVHVSRTGYTGDLGYEVWMPGRGRASRSGTPVWAATRGHGVMPFGLPGALHDPDRGRPAPARRGLRLLPVRLDRRRPGNTLELGLGWMLRGFDADDRRFIGRDALRRELAGKTSRFGHGHRRGLPRLEPPARRAGLVRPWTTRRSGRRCFLYDDDGVRSGFATSHMYSPVLQRHVGLARVPLASTAPGSRVKLELAVSHRYEYVDAHVTRPASSTPAEDR